ncbi:MAG: 3'-5' exonuclease [Bacteroidales bacterium]|nr:3'-5' exonuclease [Bacteroidales bacterium]
MKLQLQKPIAFFDLETTGIDFVKDKIVEISILKVMPNGDENAITRRVNPEMHIPEAATAVHHITDADVADKPPFRQIAKEIAEMLKDCDIAGYNSNKFDVPLLAEEFSRANVDFDWSKRKFIDVHVLFLKKEPRTLSAAYKFYCKKDLEGAHAADADTYATYEVLQAQLDKYPDIQNNVEFLSEYTHHTNNVDFAGRIIYNEKKQEVFNFGKYKGQLVSDVFRKDPSYYSWMMNGDFLTNTKQVITAIKLRTFGK